MPSTYSSALRLELMATGENSGTWGTKTNTNLGTLVEQAITGVESVIMTDATYTLTALNGASDEARNAVVTMTGSLTANRNVIIPSAEKVYNFRNSTSGGFSIVVKTASGSGVTIASGMTVTVYCDGTDCTQGTVPFNASTGSIGVTGDVAVGGNLAVTGTVTGSAFFFMPPGVVLEYAGASAPTGYLACDGTAVSRATYAALFAAIGTSYGAGDGSTTFNVPDRRDKTGVGAGSSYVRGATGGSTTTGAAGSHSHGGTTGSTVLNTTQIPAHTHTASTGGAGSHAHTFAINVGTTSIGGANAGSAFGGTYSSLDPYISTAPNHTHSVTVDNAGGGLGHDHTISTQADHTHTAMVPYVAFNYIIKT